MGGGLLGDPKLIQHPLGTSQLRKPPAERNFLAPFINRQSVGLCCDPWSPMD